MLKLYQSEGSPNSRRVRIFLAEKDLQVAMVSVDLANREQRSNPYRRINPSQVVPALVLDDGVVIGEVPAIWRYLEESYPQKPLLGVTSKQKALITMWERRMELEGFAAVIEGARNGAESLKGRAIAGPHDYDQIPALVARGRLRVANFLSDLNARLGEVPFVAGDHFSVADITARVTLDFAAKALAIGLPEEHRALASWYDGISGRASTAA